MIELGIFTVQRLDKLQSNLGRSAQHFENIEKITHKWICFEDFLPYYLKHTLMMTNV